MFPMCKNFCFKSALKNTFLVDQIILSVDRGMTYCGEKKDICTSTHLSIIILYINSKATMWGGKKKGKKAMRKEDSQ